MLKTREELSALREKVQKAYALETKKIIVCAGTGCVAGGSLKIYDRLRELAAEKNLKLEIALEVDPHDETI